ncbi:thioredoxin family protein [Leeuwenhoekiella sp. H156]|uniref:thioredoxin family protein n=1 Tax=Leeuwenhoekiella sp. H156 TaxID=3450128 RepID=UPI003FA4B7A5
MKYLIILIMIFGLSENINDETIDWNTNLESAMELADSENKPIFIYFGADWCAPCRITENQVFSESKFIEFSKKYIMVKIYDDFNKENKKGFDYYQEKKTEYKITSIPVFVIVNKKVEKGRFSGIFHTPMELINKINSYK